MGRPVVFSTQHGKDLIVAPIFSSILGWEVVAVPIDTDRFGTFSGDIARIAGPEQTALAKARAGLEDSGATRALASEGSIAPDPRMPLMTRDQEVIVFVDTQLGIELAQWHSSADIVAMTHRVDSDTDWDELAIRADLPHHAVIVKNAGTKVEWVRKGLRDINQIRQAVDECHDSTGQEVVVETDYRAMVCPSRQAVIAACATELANRLATPCPSCEGPGFGVVGNDYGLPCRACGTISEGAIQATQWGCLVCPFTRREEVATPTIDPAWCAICNP